MIVVMGDLVICMLYLGWYVFVEGCVWVWLNGVLVVCDGDWFVCGCCGVVCYVWYVWV